MARTEFHGFEDSVRWRLKREGLEIEGTGVERTNGAPATVTSVWERYNREINEAARNTKVPSAIIVATICTESGGKADAVRTEPGYVSDEKTPHRVSVGLTQTLISTARDAMQMSFGRDWLLVPGNAIQAGTNYIAKQAAETLLDPPLVAAAYNAGKLYHQTGAENRWKLRQYPIGTGKHCDRFVRFFNDAVFVLAQHEVRPAVDIDVLLSCAPGEQPASPSQPRKKAADIKIRFATNAKAADLTPYSDGVLRDICAAAELPSVLISSTSRNPSEQARVMYDNLERHGIAHQRELYGRGGNRVIDVYAKSKQAGKPKDAILADMRDKVAENPTSVSRHASDPKILNVFDVAPSSVANQVAFERAVRAEQRVDVKSFFKPPKDPGYHLEIPQPREAA